MCPPRPPALVTPPVSNATWLCQRAGADLRRDEIVDFALRSFRENEPFGENRRLTVHGKGYGVKIKEDPESTYEKFKQRRRMLEQKLKLCDWSFFLAVVGIVLAIVDVEINALDDSYVKLSTCLRIIIVFSTFLLDALVIGYHLIEVKISLTETGHNQWSLGFGTERVFRLITELIICSICPYPGTGAVTWPLLGFHPQHTPRTVDIPVHVLLVIPMFLRLYIACRFMVLHSSMFQVGSKCFSGCEETSSAKILSPIKYSK
uniref:Ion_trans domain-containing protein n=1 Tax=Steinernema glaseri TaxID=37863 RepID=A0A1I7ZRX3_9BILA